MTTQDRWNSPRFQVLIVLGYENGVQQVSFLEVNGRSEWKTKRIAERHAKEFRQIHGKEAYVSEC